MSARAINPEDFVYSEVRSASDNYGHDGEEPKSIRQILLFRVFFGLGILLMLGSLFAVGVLAVVLPLTSSFEETKEALRAFIPIALTLSSIGFFITWWGASRVK